MSSSTNSPAIGQSMAAEETTTDPASASAAATRTSSPPPPPRSVETKEEEEASDAPTMKEEIMSPRRMKQADATNAAAVATPPLQSNIPPLLLSTRTSTGGTLKHSNTSSTADVVAAVVDEREEEEDGGKFATSAAVAEARTPRHCNKSNDPKQEAPVVASSNNGGGGVVDDAADGATSEVRQHQQPSSLPPPHNTPQYQQHHHHHQQRERSYSQGGESRGGSGERRPVMLHHRSSYYPPPPPPHAGYHHPGYYDGGHYLESPPNPYNGDSAAVGHHYHDPRYGAVLHAPPNRHPPPNDSDPRGDPPRGGQLLSSSSDPRGNDPRAVGDPRMADHPRHHYDRAPIDPYYEAATAHYRHAPPPPPPRHHDYYYESHSGPHHSHYPREVLPHPRELHHNPPPQSIRDSSREMNMQQASREHHHHHPLDSMQAREHQATEGIRELGRERLYSHDGGSGLYPPRDVGREAYHHPAVAAAASAHHPPPPGLSSRSDGDAARELSRDGISGREQQHHNHHRDEEVPLNTSRDRGASIATANGSEEYASKGDGSLHAVSSSFSNEGKSLKAAVSSDDTGGGGGGQVKSQQPSAVSTTTMSGTPGHVQTTGQKEMGGVGFKQSPGVITNEGSVGESMEEGSSHKEERHHRHQAALSIPNQPSLKSNDDDDRSTSDSSWRQLQQIASVDKEEMLRLETSKSELTASTASATLSSQEEEKENNNLLKNSSSTLDDDDGKQGKEVAVPTPKSKKNEPADGTTTVPTTKDGDAAAASSSDEQHVKQDSPCALQSAPSNLSRTSSLSNSPTDDHLPHPSIGMAHPHHGEHDEYPGAYPRSMMHHHPPPPHHHHPHHHHAAHHPQYHHPALHGAHHGGGVPRGPPHHSHPPPHSHPSRLNPKTLGLFGGMIPQPGAPAAEGQGGGALAVDDNSPSASTISTKASLAAATHVVASIGGGGGGGGYKPPTPNMKPKHPSLLKKSREELLESSNYNNTHEVDLLQKQQHGEVHAKRRKLSDITLDNNHKGPSPTSSDPVSSSSRGAVSHMALDGRVMAESPADASSICNGGANSNNSQSSLELGAMPSWETAGKPLAGWSVCSGMTVGGMESLGKDGMLGSAFSFSDMIHNKMKNEEDVTHSNNGGEASGGENDPSPKSILSKLGEKRKMAPGTHVQFSREDVPSTSAQAAVGGPGSGSRKRGHGMVSARGGGPPPPHPPHAEDYYYDYPPRHPYDYHRGPPPPPLGLSSRGGYPRDPRSAAAAEHYHAYYAEEAGDPYYEHYYGHPPPPYGYPPHSRQGGGRHHEYPPPHGMPPRGAANGGGRGGAPPVHTPPSTNSRNASTSHHHPHAQFTQHPSSSSHHHHNINHHSHNSRTVLPTTNSTIGGCAGSWSKEDDAALMDIMKKIKNPKNWEPIAKKLDCNKSSREVQERWTRYLKPGSRKGQWTDEEDAVVMDAVQNSMEDPFTRWSDLAQRLPGRVGKQVRDRWVNHLNPAINHLPFSREDDVLLWQGHAALGKRWVEISTKYFKSSRSENHIKNRWYSASFKKFIAKEFGPDAYRAGNDAVGVGIGGGGRKGKSAIGAGGTPSSMTIMPVVEHHPYHNGDPHHQVRNGAPIVSGHRENSNTYTI